MIKNIMISAIAVFSLYGCVSSSPRNQVQIKSMSDADFKKYLDEDAQMKFQFSTPQIQAKDETWVDSQKSNCKIFAASSFKEKDPTVKFYWDGECKDGYAIGLGREFSIGRQTYVEAIGEYEGGRKLPSYFYSFNKVEKLFLVGYLKDRNKSIVLFRGVLDNNNVFKKTITFYDFNQNSAYEKMSYDDTSVQGKSYLSSGGLSIKQGFFNNDPLIQQQVLVQMNGKDLYSFDVFKDGRRLFTDTTSSVPVLVKPSQNLKEFLTTKLSLIDDKTNNKNDLDIKKALSADKKINTYINLTCTSSDYIKEVGKDNYFAICSPYKSLGIFKDQIQQGKEFVNQQMQKRREEVNQHLVQQKIRTQQNEQLEVEQRQKSQEGWATLFNAITEVSNGVANSYNQQAEMYNNFSKNMPSSSFPTLNKQKSTFNCVNIGMNTTCRER